MKSKCREEIVIYSLAILVAFWLFLALFMRNIIL